MFKRETSKQTKCRFQCTRKTETISDYELRKILADRFECNLKENGLVRDVHSIASDLNVD